VLQLMSRKHCPLCQQAERVVAAVAASRNMLWELIDIDNDAELVARYGWDVPVLRWRQQTIMQHHFNPQVLNKTLISLLNNKGVTT